MNQPTKQNRARGFILKRSQQKRLRTLGGIDVWAQFGEPAPSETSEQKKKNSIRDRKVRISRWWWWWWWSWWDDNNGGDRLHHHVSPAHIGEPTPFIHPINDQYGLMQPETPLLHWHIVDGLWSNVYWSFHLHPTRRISAADVLDHRLRTVVLCSPGTEPNVKSAHIWT